MAKAVADGNKEIQGGFASNDGESKPPELLILPTASTDLTTGHQVTGFSHMHDSGTGGVSCNILVKFVYLLKDFRVPLSETSHCFLKRAARGIF